MQHIYHVAYAREWKQAIEAGSYRISTRGHVLDDGGFIHCSFLHQIDDVVRDNYSGERGLVVLEIDPASVDAEVRVEDGFPHLYGPLPVEAVVNIRPLIRQS